MLFEGFGWMVWLDVDDLVQKVGLELEFHTLIYLWRMRSNGKRYIIHYI